MIKSALILIIVPNMTWLELTQVILHLAVNKESAHNSAKTADFCEVKQETIINNSKMFPKFNVT